MLLAVPVSISATQVGLGLAVAGVLAVAARERRLPRTPLDAPVLVLAAVTVGSAALSGDPATALRKCASLWLVLAMYAVVARFREPGELAGALRFAVPGAVALGVFGVVQHFTGWRLPGSPPEPLHSLALAGRTVWFPRGGFGHYQTYANVFYLLFCLFAGLAAAGGGGRARIAAGVAAAASAAAVLFSFTRGVWLSLLAGCAVLLWTFARRALLPLAAASAALLVLAAVAPSTLRSRVASMTDAGTNVERLLLWETTWEMLRDHPVLGIGVGRYREVQARYVRDEVPMIMTPTHAHNIWLQAAVERGIPGLAAFCWLLAATVRVGVAGVRRRRAGGGVAAGLAAGALAGVAGFIVDGVVQNNFGDAQATLLFWVVAGAAVVCLAGAGPGPAEAAA